MPALLPTLSFDEANRRFVEALNKQLATAKRDKNAVVATQFKGVIQRVFNYTPPMSSRGPSFIEGRRAGQLAMRRDMYKFFRVIPNKRKIWQKTKRGLKALVDLYGQDAIPAKLNNSVDWFFYRYKSVRGRDKRIVGKWNVPVWESTFENIFRKLILTQGWVASGWMPAAKEMDAKVTEWIASKSGSGSFKKKITPEEAVFEAKNITSHVDSARIQHNLSYALLAQANAANRAFEYYLKKITGISYT